MSDINNCDIEYKKEIELLTSLVDEGIKQKYEEIEKENERLKKQIELMRNCFNCEHEIECMDKIVEDSEPECKDLKNWEMKK